MYEISDFDAAQIDNTGYHDCPCRDCFEIAIGCDDHNRSDLCWECEEAGCDASGKSDCEVQSEPDDELDPQEGGP